MNPTRLPIPHRVHLHSACGTHGMVEHLMPGPTTALFSRGQLPGSHLAGLGTEPEHAQCQCSRQGTPPELDCTVLQASDVHNILVKGWMAHYCQQIPNLGLHPKMLANAFVSLFSVYTPTPA